MNKITLSIVGTLAIAAAAPSARAATFGEWLAFCAGGSTEIDAKIKTDSLATCGFEEGVKSACSVLSGTPWTCATPAAMPKGKDEVCDSNMLTFNVGGKFEMPATWKVSGTASITFTRLAQKTNITICNASPVIPTPTGMGGGYSAESGDIAFRVEMTLMGEIMVTSPLGVSVTLNGALGCRRTTNGHYFKKADINSCGSPTPTPSPTAPPASPTPSGTPSGTPSPTPSGTPSGTPSPTPHTSPTPAF